MGYHNNYSSCASAWWNEPDNNEYEKHWTRDSRMYTHGNKIHSYGSHFTIAQKVYTERGMITLWNESTYSLTTSRHQWEVRSVIEGVVLETPNGELNHKENLEYYKEQIEFYEDKLKRARKDTTRQRYQGEIVRYKLLIKDYITYFPQAIKLRMNGSWAA